MILNPDGTPYVVRGSLRTFDPCANTNDKALYNSYDAEIIRINGTLLYYYEVFIDVIDPLYHEARSKIWTQQPVMFYGYYDPIASQNYMNMFGIDSPDEITFETNYSEVLAAVGHKPKIGSRIFSPHKGEHWEIKQNNVADWKLWGEIRLSIICDRFQENLTTGEGKVTQQEYPFTVR